MPSSSPASPARAGRAATWWERRKTTVWRRARWRAGRPPISLSRALSTSPARPGGTIGREAGAGRAGRKADRFPAEERSQNGFAAILGESPALRQVIEQARRVAAHREVTVLVEGETGTGKELIARATHYHSPRSAAPFVEINCTAIPATLIESELFGHEKGAFTGAVASRPGLFELAHGGTIFLDEVGHLPLEAQPKLLRVLEARQVRRVGGQATRGVDVRVIAATHVDLRSAV